MGPSQHLTCCVSTIQQLQGTALKEQLQGTVLNGASLEIHEIIQVLCILYSSPMDCIHMCKYLEAIATRLLGWRPFLFRFLWLLACFTQAKICRIWLSLERPIGLGPYPSSICSEASCTCGSHRRARVSRVFQVTVNGPVFVFPNDQLCSSRLSGPTLREAQVAQKSRPGEVLDPT